MFNRFFKKLNIKLRRLSLEGWGMGLFTLMAIALAIGFISIFNEATKQAEMYKATAQLTAAKSHREQLYEELINLVYFEMFDKEHLDEEEYKKTYKADIWDVINSIVLLPDYYYRRLLEDIKVLREMSLNLKMSSLPVSSEVIKQRDFWVAQKGSKEAFDNIFTFIEDDYKVLIKDILNLPTRYYNRFLSLLDELREFEKSPSSKSGG